MILLKWSDLGAEQKAEQKRAHLKKFHSFPMGHGGVGVTVQRLLRAGVRGERQGRGGKKGQFQMEEEREREAGGGQRQSTASAGAGGKHQGVRG
jgi:hypothetical protein